MKVKVTRNYQITIPVKVRKKLNIKEGQYLIVEEDEKNNAIIIKPIEWVKLRLGRKLTQEDINRVIEKHDKDIIEEEYPEIKRWKKKE
ncbi:MAG: AbrB/MazE/SpoVT family DNA-binding domain-containing protein [Candidatus Nanopusillus sp.]